MAKVGIRELSEHTSEIIRKVREEQATYEVTLRGEVVARIESVTSKPSQEEIQEYWERHDALANEIAKDWPKGLSAAEAVKEQRREL